MTGAWAAVRLLVHICCAKWLTHLKLTEVQAGACCAFAALI